MCKDSHEGGGEVIVGPAKEEYFEGEVKILTAIVNKDFAFLNWIEDTDNVAGANAASTILTMPAQDVTLTANFEEDGGGNGEPGTGVTDIDGNFYPSAIISNQEWMAENLRVTQYNNGDVIPTGLNNTDWGNTTDGAYAIYGNDNDMFAAYGALYNWYAVDDARGLCPTGWHVPSDAEWFELVNYVVEQGFPNSYVINGAGNALKSCRQVSSPLGGDCATSEHPRWDSHSTFYGTDEFGYSALPGGARNSNGFYLSLGRYATWWSSTESSTTHAWFWNLYDLNGSSVARSSIVKSNGFSVRCVRDN